MLLHDKRAVVTGAGSGIGRAVALGLAREGAAIVCADLGLSEEEFRQKAEQRKSRIPLGRIGLPEDLVGPSLFLVSDLSAWMTGVILPVNGGMYLS